MRNKPAVELFTKTSPGWARLAVERFDEVLVDHAHCEKKAAANALSMLAAFPDVPGLARDAWESTPLVLLRNAVLLALAVAASLRTRPAGR